MNNYHHMLDNKSLFGKDFKYILSLTALVWTAYTLPQVQASIAAGSDEAWSNLDSSALSANVGSYASPSPQTTPACSAALTGYLSIDSGTPVSQTIMATNLQTGSFASLPVLVFDLGASSGHLHLKNAIVHIATSGSGSVNVAYLYSGAVQIATASVVNSIAQFTNIPVVTAYQGSVAPIVVKVDATGISPNSAGLTVSASIFAADVVVQDSFGNGAAVSGGANGNPTTVVSSGPQFTEASSPVITKTNITPGGVSYQVFQYSATFNVQVVAVGTNLTFGLPATANPAWNTAIGSMALYVNGVKTALPSGAAVAYSQPTGTMISADGKSFIVAANQTVTVPVTVSFTVSNPGANVYGVQMEGINWTSASMSGPSTFMLDNPAWRTNLI